MPPGMWHEVYTPVKCIASGGHFLTYETMHLTQWARWVDSDSATSATNADHAGIVRTISRMVLGLRRIRDSKFAQSSPQLC
jgi:hypothetical protein